MTNRLIAALTFTLAALSFGAAAPNAAAQENSPVGLWKTIDDHSGKPKSLVRISEVNGEYQGKVEKLFPEPGRPADPKCVKCKDERKDQPVLGMTIITGMKRDGDEYGGGRILDPANGSVYKSKMMVLDGGKKLEVRGYIGMPILGRSQTWLREE